MISANRGSFVCHSDTVYIVANYPFQPLGEKNRLVNEKIMKKRHLWLIALLVCQATWSLLNAQDKMDPLPIDPKVRYGRLQNGLTYYIRHNEQPKERADFYIAQNVGSILEEEHQRGLAHFLEHMAFNGSKHFPGHGMDDYIERVGMRGGENFNAYTSFDETVYMVMNAPVKESSVVDSCLLILHDWSGFITLADTAIEQERGVIREEWRTGQNAQARMWEQQLPEILPGSRYAHRMPIGAIDVINHFKPEELRAYYKKWYRPDLQAIIVVGDVDVDRVENSLKQIFADIPAPVNAAKRNEEAVPDNEEPLVSIATDREAPATTLFLFYKHDKLPREMAATIVGMEKDYVQAVCSAMMNERFDELLHQANPPFVYAEAADGNYMVARTKEAWTVAALVKEGAIDSTLTTMVMETERLKQFGFTQSEYERARINVLRQYESAYNERDNQPNSSYTTEYVHHFTEGGSIPGIEMEYALMSRIAPNITLQQVNQYIQSVIGEKNIVISLTGPDKEGIVYPSEEELLRIFREAQKRPVEPYKETVSDKPLIPSLPQPGTIVEKRSDPLFGATVMRLSNGVQVVVKPTEFKKDQIQMMATSPGGSTLFGDEDAVNLKVFGSVIGLGGLGDFSAIELGKSLAGKNVTCSPYLGMDEEGLSGSVSPKDLKSLFELIYLHFTAPRMDEEAFASFTSRMKSQLQHVELDPSVAFADTLTWALYQDNPRAQRLRLQEIDRISYPRIMQMYKDRFADASDFVFTFVGAIEPDSIETYIEQYLATLPALNRIEKGNSAEVPAYRKGEYVNVFNRPMETPKSTVMNLYNGEMSYDLENRVVAQMLKQILDLVYMEKVREKEGGTYGVSSSVVVSSFPEGRTLLQIQYDTDPAKREQMNRIVRDELKRLADEGPREADFVKTRDHLLKRHAESLQENGYWLSVLDNYYARHFDQATRFEAVVKAITPDKIRTFVKKLLAEGNRVEVVMTTEEGL